jgi:hypothetical protein
MEEHALLAQFGWCLAISPTSTKKSTHRLQIVLVGTYTLGHNRLNESETQAERAHLCPEEAPSRFR